MSTWDSALAPVKFPDVNPAVIPPTASFSMTAGDFLEVYTKEGKDMVKQLFHITTQYPNTTTPLLQHHGIVS